LWWRPLLETPAKKFDLVMGVNARAAFLCARAFVPGMIERRWGHIVNMSPPVAAEAVSGQIAYWISKFGVTILTHGLAAELRPHNVAVHSLWPVTMVESQATIHHHLGEPKDWRKAAIMADATVALVTKDPGARSGLALSDEEVLRAEGVVDFDRYACVPGSTPPPITAFPKR
jgi:citronellol/citronellal dehydrogenase